MERLREARERVQRLTAERRRAGGIKSAMARKREARRRLLAGAWLLEAVEGDEVLRQRFAEHLKTARLRKSERELFADEFGKSPPVSGKHAE